MLQVPLMKCLHVLFIVFQFLLPLFCILNCALMQGYGMINAFHEYLWDKDMAEINCNHHINLKNIFE